MTTYIANGYQQDNGDNKKWWIIAIILLGFILFIISSCNPTKQLDKAKQKVLTDSSAFDYVGRKFVALNPCANIVKYKSDTIVSHDTTETFYHYTDSINHTDTVTKTIKIVTTKTIHDTTTIIDDEALKLSQSQLAQRDLTIAGTNGQLLAAHEAVTSAEKKTRTVEIILGAIVLIFVGTIAFKIYKAVTGGAVVGAATSTSSSIISTITNAFKKK